MFLQQSTGLQGGRAKKKPATTKAAATAAKPPATTTTAADMTATQAGTGGSKRPAEAEPKSAPATKAVATAAEAQAAAGAGKAQPKVVRGGKVVEAPAVADNAAAKPSPSTAPPAGPDTKAQQPGKSTMPPPPPPAAAKARKAANPPPTFTATAAPPSVPAASNANTVAIAAAARKAAAAVPPSTRVPPPPLPARRVHDEFADLTTESEMDEPSQTHSQDVSVQGNAAKRLKVSRDQGGNITFPGYRTFGTDADACCKCRQWIWNLLSLMLACPLHTTVPPDCNAVCCGQSRRTGTGGIAAAGGDQGWPLLPVPGHVSRHVGAGAWGPRPAK